MAANLGFRCSHSVPLSLRPPHRAPRTVPEPGALYRHLFAVRANPRSRSSARPSIRPVTKWLIALAEAESASSALPCSALLSSFTRCGGRLSRIFTVFHVTGNSSKSLSLSLSLSLSVPVCSSVSLGSMSCNFPRRRQVRNAILSPFFLHLRTDE